MKRHRIGNLQQGLELLARHRPAFFLKLAQACHSQPAGSCLPNRPEAGASGLGVGAEAAD